MKAMILAAGFGTRLRPLTNEKPKALIEVAGRPLLEWVILKLRFFGFQSIVINTHHFPEKIEAFLAKRKNFGIEILISREEKILGTGGGIKQVADFLADVPAFLVHNVDVLSTLDLAEFMKFHQENHNLATLFVQDRDSKRALRFNQNNLLEGRWDPSEPVNPGAQRLAFNGVHAISSAIFRFFPEDGFFSITDVYLAAATAGAKIRGFHPEEVYWRDLGRIDTLKVVNQEIAQHPDLARRLVGSNLQK